MSGKHFSVAVGNVAVITHALLTLKRDKPCIWNPIYRLVAIEYMAELRMSLYEIHCKIPTSSYGLVRCHGSKRGWLHGLGEVTHQTIAIIYFFTLLDKMTSMRKPSEETKKCVCRFYGVYTVESAMRLTQLRFGRLKLSIRVRVKSEFSRITGWKLPSEWLKVGIQLSAKSSPST